MFSCEYCETFENTDSEEHLRTFASVLSMELDVGLTMVIYVQNLNHIGFGFLFESVWLRSLVTKQKLRTKFANRL